MLTADAVTVARVVSVFMLQWGRGLLTADARDGSLIGADSPALQWGRGLLTADAFGLRAQGGRRAVLQWGRGLLTADAHTWCVTR